MNELASYQSVNKIGFAMRHPNRQKHVKAHQRSAFIRRNYFFILEQQNNNDPLPKIDEFENLKQLLEGKKCRF